MHRNIQSNMTSSTLSQLTPVQFLSIPTNTYIMYFPTNVLFTSNIPNNIPQIHTFCKQCNKKKITFFSHQILGIKSTLDRIKSLMFIQERKKEERGKKQNKKTHPSYFDTSILTYIMGDCFGIFYKPVKFIDMPFPSVLSGNQVWMMLSKISLCRCFGVEGSLSLRQLNPQCRGMKHRIGHVFVAQLSFQCAEFLSLSEQG